MPEVEFMNRDDIPVRKHIFLYAEQSGTPEIYNTIIIFSRYHFTDTVVFRAWAVVDKITQLNGVRCPSVIGQNHRKQIKSV